MKKGEYIDPTELPKHLAIASYILSEARKALPRSMSAASSVKNALEGSTENASKELLKYISISLSNNIPEVLSRYILTEIDENVSEGVYPSISILLVESKLTILSTTLLIILKKVKNNKRLIGWFHLLRSDISRSGDLKSLCKAVEIAIISLNKKDNPHSVSSNSCNTKNKKS
jgi:hypothetical protein